MMLCSGRTAPCRVAAPQVVADLLLIFRCRGVGGRPHQTSLSSWRPGMVLG